MKKSPPRKTLQASAPGKHTDALSQEQSSRMQSLLNTPLSNEAYLELTADAADVGLWSLDLQKNVYWTNSKAQEIFNIPPGETLTAEGFRNKVHPDDLDIVVTARARAVERNHRVNLEYRIVLPDSSIRWIQTRGTLFKPAGDTTSYIMGASTDITDRKQGELARVRHLQFEALLAEISSSFSRYILPSDLNRQIELGLAKVLDYFGGDRCGLVRLDLIHRTAKVSHAFYREGLTQIPVDYDLAPLFPWSVSRGAAGQCHHFSDFSDLPPEAETDRGTWTAMGVKSAMHMPLVVDDSNVFLMTISSLSTPLSWTGEMLSRIKLVCELFMNVIYRGMAEQEIRNSYAEIILLKEKLEVEADYLRAEVRATRSHDEIIGQSEPLKKVLIQAEQVAPTNSTVIVTGETGSGKELIAQMIHNTGPRRKKLMVKVNCAALPPLLIENELFGREKGAYTGAMTRQAGRFELADGSTIFLDEISELSLELQAKLLRVLQGGEFERLGSPKTIKVDVRVIAATNRNLMDEVRQGRFREDLYYRLNVFPIHVPPLRERLEDIPMLVWEFLREFSEKMGKKITRINKKEMASLQSYSWPGNIRELRNVVEHGVIISSGNELTVRIPQKGQTGNTQRVTLEHIEKNHIEAILRQTGWRIKGPDGAAVILGINPATLYARMKKLGIPQQREKLGETL
jgi:PAS domain S-box-containing protein